MDPLRRPAIAQEGWAGQWAPYTASAGEKLDPSLHADRIPNITQGRCVTHLSPAARARRASLSRRWNLSTSPLDCR